MKRLATTTYAAVAMAAAIATVGAQAADVAGVTDTEIKVGTFGPLTGGLSVNWELVPCGLTVTVRGTLWLRAPLEPVRNRPNP